MFHRLHTFREARLVIVGPRIDASLQDRRPAIELRGHEVHGRAMFGVTRGEYAPVRMQTGILWQQRGMDVEDPAGKTGDERCAQDPHETGEHDQRRCTARHGFRERRIETAARGEIRGPADFGRHPEFARNTETARVIGRVQTGDRGVVIA